MSVAHPRIVQRALPLAKAPMAGFGYINDWMIGLDEMYDQTAIFVSQSDRMTTKGARVQLVISRLTLPKP